MPLRPYSRGLSSFRREPVRGAAAKMGLPWDAYYVLTKAEARLTNSKLHPNTGSPDYDITHLHTGLEDTNWATEPSHDPRYFTHAEVLDLIEGAAFSFHPSDTADGTIAGYNIMFDLDTDEAESTIGVEIIADDTLIKAFITETGQPTFTALAAGVYAGNLHLLATTAGKKDTKIYWTLLKRAAGGAETLLITSEESAVLTNTETHYEIHGVLTTDQTLLSDDRLVFKVYGNQDTGAGGDATATLYMEGTTATRVDVLTHFLAFDDRYVQVTGDTMTGSLAMGDNSVTGLDTLAFTDYSGVLSTEAGFGYATFDGDSGYINIGQDASLNIAGKEITLSGWFRTTDAHTGLGHIISKWIDPTNTSSYRLVMSTGNIFFQLRNSSESQFVNVNAGVSDLNDGLWHHALGTYDGVSAETAVIYIDGDAKDTDTSVTDDIRSLVRPVLIGASKSAAPTAFWNGDLDEVMVFNKPFIASEVTTLFNLGRNFGSYSGPHSGDLVAHFRFNGDVTDDTGTNNGTIIDTVTVVGLGDSIKSSIPLHVNNSLFVENNATILGNLLLVGSVLETLAVAENLTSPAATITTLTSTTITAVELNATDSFTGNWTNAEGSQVEVVNGIITDVT